MEPRPATWLLAALAHTILGCGVSSEAVGQARGRIVGGTVDLDDPAVVALTYQGEAFCTGTLVAPDAVLTAAHCVAPDINPIPIESMQVFFGSDVAAGDGVFVDVSGGGPSPSFAHMDPDFEYHDVGMLRLARPGPATPLALPDEPLDDDFIGETVREVGFGLTGLEADDSGVKREGTSKVIKFRGTLFRADPAPATLCNGDSGGPSLFPLGGGDEVVVGVHSGGDCATFAADQRVDLEMAEFILPFLAGSSATPCAADGYCATWCDAPDADCPPDCAVSDGACDEACPVEDPDCSTECAADGACDATCLDDPDCGGEPCPTTAPCQPQDDARPEDAGGAGGCSMARNDPPRGLGGCPALLLLFAASRVARRRRRRAPLATGVGWESPG